MKLYYMPGACALAPHIVANELGIKLDLIRVSMSTKQTEHGEDFLAINPNGYVPALVLDDGQVLTEVAALVQYLADQKPEAGLLPPVGQLAHYRVLEALSFAGTELHKAFAAFFRPGTPEETKEASRELLKKRIGFVDNLLAKQAYIAGETYTIADAYAWVVLSWARIVKFDLSAFAHVQRWQATIAARPAVQLSLKEEGLA
ncbi:glutathione transferase GstA [Kerstersia similis]|uniref:glutathione transferase GstA n=1 Tax=Kerstersia similis TaxID=206505 RepID=UPI0039F11EB6